MFRFLILIAVLLTACQSTGVLPQLVQPGVLQGHVNIGPLTPVERIGVPTPTVSPTVYAARQVVVYKSNGQTVVTRLNIDAKGDYRVDLAPGEYVVNMAKSGIDRARGLPATVTIQSNLTTTLDISIDTGIR